MRISKNYIVREIADEYIIVPTGREALNFQGLITVNETGAFLWNLLQEESMTEDSLTEALCEAYEIEKTTAKQDVKEFLKYVKQRRILINEGEN